MPTIAEPLILPCGAVLTGRIAKSATSEGLADASGAPTPNLVRLYSSWANGGFGLIITGNIIVDRDHIERTGNVVIDGEPTTDMMAALRSWATSAKGGGAHVWAQLSHAGRRTVMQANSHPLSASPIRLAASGHPFSEPDEILAAEVEWAVEKFARAARVCKDAGFTGVQVLAGQKHLISSFLNPESNRRSDRWGGCAENRNRFLILVVKAVRTSVGNDFPIGVKLDVDDFRRPQSGSDEFGQVVAALEAAGVDLLELSGGRYKSRQLVGELSGGHDAHPASGAFDKATRAESPELLVARRWRKRMCLMLTGGMRTLSSGNLALAKGADMVGVARPLCVDPLALKRLLAGEIDELQSWEKCNQSSKTLFDRISPWAPLHRLRPINPRYWFCAQLYRLGGGAAARLDLDSVQAFREVTEFERSLLIDKSLDQRRVASCEDREASTNSKPARSAAPRGDERSKSLREATMHPWPLFKRGVMSVWYVHANFLTRLYPSITIEGKKLTISPGVYKPLENESVCAEYCRAGDRVLDLGSGSGVCSIFCAPIAREVIAIDISAVAVKNTQENCARLGVTNVTAFQSDMFAQVKGRFNLIVANAPYVAADFESEQTQFATSVRYLPILFTEANNYLAENGRLLVQFPMWFRGRIEALAERHGLKVVAVRRMPPKSFALSLLSLAYLQVGFRSAYFLIQPIPGERLKLAA